MVTVRSEEVSVTVNNTRQHVTRLETVSRLKVRTTLLTE